MSSVDSPNHTLSIGLEKKELIKSHKPVYMKILFFLWRFGLNFGSQLYSYFPSTPCMNLGIAWISMSEVKSWLYDWFVLLEGNGSEPISQLLREDAQGVVISIRILLNAHCICSHCTTLFARTYFISEWAFLMQTLLHCSSDLLNTMKLSTN